MTDLHRPDVRGLEIGKLGELDVVLPPEMASGNKVTQIVNRNDGAVITVRAESHLVKYLEEKGKIIDRDIYADTIVKVGQDALKAAKVEAIVGNPPHRGYRYLEVMTRTRMYEIPGRTRVASAKNYSDIQRGVRF